MKVSSLPQSSPEAQGLSSAAINDFVTSVDEKIQYLHSFMLLRHGVVVAAGWWLPYGPDTPHMLFSLSKSFTSTAVGLAVAEGRLSVDDHLIDFFPDDLPETISPSLAAMKVQHLLSMSTGHHEDTIDRVMSADNPMAAFLSLPVEHEPGTHFAYNSGASFMLAAIVQKLTGESLVDYLTPRLFEPLGIRDATWDSHHSGIAYGGWGLNLRTEDVARFGQLCLQKGLWQGQQLVPADWVETATAKQVSNDAEFSADWSQGYGFQFWRCEPQDVYRADGAFGQFCIVMPQQDAVLAITGGVMDMQSVLDLVWKKLLPAMDDETLPSDPTTALALEQQLNSLALHPTQGIAGSMAAAKFSGKTFMFEPDSSRLIAQTFGFEPKPDPVQSICFDFDASTMTYCLIGNDQQPRTHTLNYGAGTWVESTADLGQPTPAKVAASGVWTAENTFTLEVCHYETPFTTTHTFVFADDRVTLKSRTDLGFGPPMFCHAVGSLQGS